MLYKPALDSKKEQSQLVRTIGERLKEARELCNMTQQTAAKKLGYRNSSKLAKIEKASDTNSVPIWLILRASKLYDVSVDFLFGMNDDWEKSARLTIERKTGLWLNEQWEKMRRRDLAVIQSLCSRIETLDSAVSEHTRLAKDLDSALASFRSLNPQFDDMRGGNRLLSVSGKITEAISESESRMRRFRQECASSAAALQLDLFHEENNHGKADD